MLETLIEQPLSPERSSPNDRLKPFHPLYSRVTPHLLHIALDFQTSDPEVINVGTHHPLLKMIEPASTLLVRTLSPLPP